MFLFGSYFLGSFFPSPLMCGNDLFVCPVFERSPNAEILYYVFASYICISFQCLVLLSHASLKKFGYYRIILFSFYFEGVAAAVMFVLGPGHYHLLAFYLTTNM